VNAPSSDKASALSKVLVGLVNNSILLATVLMQSNITGNATVSVQPTVTSAGSDSSTPAASNTLAAWEIALIVVGSVGGLVCLGLLGWGRALKAWGKKRKHVRKKTNLGVMI
jgi:hypothetical protein